MDDNTTMDDDAYSKRAFAICVLTYLFYSLTASDNVFTTVDISEEALMLLSLLQYFLISSTVVISYFFFEGYRFTRLLCALASGMMLDIAILFVALLILYAFDYWSLSREAYVIVMTILLVLPLAAVLISDAKKTLGLEDKKSVDTRRAALKPKLIVLFDQKARRQGCADGLLLCESTRLRRYASWWRRG